MRIFKILLAASLFLFLGNTEISMPLKIYFFDVGQAECIFIELPQGENVLIDAGNDADGRYIVNHLYKKGIRKIDILIATHPHEDHIGGIDDIINAFDIDKIYQPLIIKNDIPNTLCYNNYTAALKANNYKADTLKAGDFLIESEELSISCLSPQVKDYALLNEYSVVLKIEFKSKVFLLMADAERSNESEILYNKIGRCDLLKIGHHGSATSTSKAFIEAVLPRYAIISVGADNEFSHPSKEVLRRLYKNGASIYRTDILKTICAQSDGETIRVKAYNICLDGDRF